MNIKKKVITILLIIMSVLSLLKISNAATQNPSVAYSSRIEKNGWEKDFSKVDGAMSGTSGKSLKLEQIKIKLTNVPSEVGIKYQVHAQDIGWQDWKKDGAVAGASGKRIEAIRIKLENTDEYSIKYRAHVQNVGWQDWKADGVVAGTTGKSLRIEAIEIKLEKKKVTATISKESLAKATYYAGDVINFKGFYYTNSGQLEMHAYVGDANFDKYLTIKEITDTQEQLNTSTGYNVYRYLLNIKDISILPDGQQTIKLNVVKNGSIIASAEEKITIDKSNPHVSYQTHVQNVGWQDWKNDGGQAGTTGKSLRLEGIKINIKNVPSNVKISYQTHIQNIGWQEWKTNGQQSGTTGQSLRLEGIKIKLQNSDDYSIKYRVHVQNIGWQDWKYDGQLAGTTGQSLRLEAIEISIIPKRISCTSGFNYNAKTIYSEDVNLTGFCLANVSNKTINVSIDNKSVNDKTQFSADSTLYTKYEGYGEASDTPKPVYSVHLTEDDVTKLGNGTHTFKVEVLHKNQVVYTKQYNFIIDISTLHLRYSINNGPYYTNGELVEDSNSIKQVKAYLINNHDNLKVQYISYSVEDGWENTWKEDNQVSERNNHSIRAIRFRVENDKYSIQYRLKTSGKWEDYSYDGEYAGVVESKKDITGLSARIVGKITDAKAMVCIDSPKGKMPRGIYNFAGWGVSNDPNAKLKLYLDNKSIDYDKNTRTDVLNLIKGYKGDVVTPLAGYSARVDLSKISYGKHTVKLQYETTDGKVLATQTINFEITRNITIEKGKYGKSGLAVKGAGGYDLEYYRFGDGPNVAFFTFEVHGFEDHWDRDGTELVLTAIQFFERLQDDQNYNLAEKWTIYIFPECNPDGRKKGHTNNGPGRTTLYSIYGDVGVDMNRCWSTNFEPKYNDRNYTGQFSFGAYEAQYLKDFLLSHKSTSGQTILVDCHGWLSQLIGDSDMMQYYHTQFPDNRLTYTYGKGYLISWARANLGANGKTAKSILVELPAAVNNPTDFVNQNVANRFINASISMLKGID